MNYLLFFIIVIFSRIILETTFLSDENYLGYYIVFHHFCWFSAVFLYFANVLKYILKVPPKKIRNIMLFSPIVFIPLIHGVITGEKLHLEYIVGEKGVGNLFLNILTLNYFSTQNSAQFFELLLILILFIVGSWFYSKSILKVILTVIIGFYGAFLLTGIHWFAGSRSDTHSVFIVKTAFYNQQLMSLIWYFFCVILFVLFFYPQLLSYFKHKKMVWIVLFGLLGFYLYHDFHTVMYFTLQKVKYTTADSFLIMIPWLTLWFGGFYLFLNKKQPEKQYLWVIIVIGQLIVFPLLTGTY